MSCQLIPRVTLSATRRTHLPGKIESIVIEVRNHDVPRAGITGDRDRHDADRTGARDQYVFADQVKGQRRMRRVAQRIKNRLPCRR